MTTCGLRYNLKVSKSIDTTASLDRKNMYNKHVNKIAHNEDTELMAHKSPILHMMQITLNRKENMETFLCKNENDAAIETPKSDSNDSKREEGKTKKGAGKRVLKVQAKRFKMETKAAKTLAIIVGGFICCWLPFFTIYLIRAFCETCIEPLVFSILFWLGYCNSAINPLIYALFSKEFRLAFKNIIYKCFCAKCGDCKNQENSTSSNNRNHHNASNAVR